LPPFLMAQLLLSKYDYIIVHLKANWSAYHSPILLSPVTSKQRVVKIPRDQPEEGIDDYRGNDSEKRKVLRREENAIRNVNNQSRIRS